MHTTNAFTSGAGVEAGTRVGAGPNVGGTSGTELVATLVNAGATPVNAGATPVIEATVTAGKTIWVGSGCAEAQAARMKPTRYKNERRLDMSFRESTLLVLGEDFQQI